MRHEKVAGEIREIVAALLTQQRVKDPRVFNAGLITITHVRLSSDLSHATALFMVHGMDATQLTEVADGLKKASGFLRREVGRSLRMKNTPTLDFEIDAIFEREARVDEVLAEIHRSDAQRAAGPADGTDGVDGSGVSDGSLGAVDNDN